MEQGRSLISERVHASPVTEPSADSVERVARAIAAAHRPLIITGELGRHRNGPESLVQLAQRHGIAVVEHCDRAFFNFPTHHPLHLGFNSSAFVKYADAIVVIECSDDRVTIWNDSDLDPQLVPRRLADSWFASDVRGWVFGAALGGQLANRDQTMVVVMSDSGYIASEPLAAHTVASTKKLPVVVIVMNEDASVRCDAVAEACGAKAMRVEDPRELAASIRAALQIARGDKQQVLLNVAME